MRRIETLATLAATALLVIGLGLLIAAPAIAKSGTPPGQAEAHIALVEASLSYGDQAHFTVTTNATPTLVRMTCSQDGAVVAIGGTLIYYATSYTTTREFGLASPIWASGGATCSVVVKYVTAQTPDHWRVIGETGFVVLP